MGEPSSTRSTSARPEDRAPFPRARLIVGLVLVAAVGAGAAWGLGRIRSAPSIGKLVYASDRGVFERDLRTGDARRIADLPTDVRNASPSPDGRWLAYTRQQDDLWFLDLRTARRWRASERLTAVLGWMPDGRLLAGELAGSRRLIALDPEGARPRPLYERFPTQPVVWAGGDRFLWSSGGDLAVTTVTEDGPSTTKLADDAWPLAVSPDGKEILYVSGPEGPQPRVAIAALEGEELTRRREAFPGLAYHAAASRQGFVALSGLDRSNESGVWALEGGENRPRRMADEQAESMAWSADGASLLFLVDGSVFARDLRESRIIRLTPRRTHVIGFAVVP